MLISTHFQENFLWNKNLKIAGYNQNMTNITFERGVNGFSYFSVRGTSLLRPLPLDQARFQMH